jgi:hypothetical protein
MSLRWVSRVIRRGDLPCSVRGAGPHAPAVLPALLSPGAGEGRPARCDRPNTWHFGPNGLPRGRGPSTGSTPAGGRACLPRQRRPGSRGMALTARCTADGARPCGRGPPPGPRTLDRQRSAAPRPGGSLSLGRGRKLHAGTARLREADRDRLLRRSRAMLPLSYVMHLFAHELTSLRRRGFPFAPVLFGPLQGLFFRHHVSPLRGRTLPHRDPRLT